MSNDTARRGPGDPPDAAGSAGTRHDDDVATLHGQVAQADRALIDTIAAVERMRKLAMDAFATLRDEVEGPLSSIVGYASLLEQVTPPDAAHATWLAQLLAASASALGQVDRVLTRTSADLREAAGRIPVPPRRFQGRHVLVAENTEESRRVIERLLAPTGALLTYARDGKEALEATEDFDDFDLVLMDVHMPTMGGIEAARTLRSRGFSAPILGVTADPTAATRAQALGAGYDKVLNKPVKPTELYAEVSLALRGGRDPARVSASPVGPALIEVAVAANDPPPGVAGVSAAATAEQVLARCEASTGLPAELIMDYVRTLADRARDLARSARTLDMAGLRDVGHKLAGTGASYGFAELSEAGRELERATRSGDRQGIDDSRATLAGEMDAILRAFDLAGDSKPGAPPTGGASPAAELRVAPPPAAIVPDAVLAECEATTGLPRELIEDYVRTLGERLVEFEAGYYDEDLGVLRDVGHKIAGTGASYGFPELSSAAREVELLIDRQAGWPELRLVCEPLIRRMRSVAGLVA